MKLRFIDVLSTDTNRDMPKKPHMLHFGLLMYRVHKTISSWMASCHNYIEQCKALKQPDCFSIKGKIALHQEKEQNG